MEHQGKIIIGGTKNSKSFFLWNGTETYYKKLRLAYKDIQDGKITEYSYFSFFILCAATLEYSLNYIITAYCIDKYGLKYKPYSEGYISLHFKEKIHIFPSILSDGELVFNEDKVAYKKLNELVGLRNKIMHSKETVYKIDNPNINSKKNEVTINLEPTTNPIDSLNKTECLKYGQALEAFKENIMIPALNHNLKENSLLIKNKL